MKTFGLLVGLIVVLMVSSPVTCAAQEASPSPQTAAVAPSAAPEAQKIAVLEAQVQTMKDYDERLLNTVYWSLGALGAVVFLIITLGWYTNFRIYKGDVEVIRNEMKASVEESKLGVQVELGKKVLELQTRLEELVKKSLDRNLWKTTHDVRQLQYEMRQIEVARLEAAGFLGNALYTLSEAIPIVADLDYEFYYSEILEGMSRILDRGNVLLTANGTATIVQRLKSIPNQFSVHVEKVERQIKNAENPRSATEDAQDLKPAEDVGNPKPAEDVGNPKPAEDVGNPKPAEDVGNPKLGEDVGNPKLGEDAEHPKPATTLSSR